MTTLEEAWGENFNTDLKKYKKYTNKYKNKTYQQQILNKEHKPTRHTESTTLESEESDMYKSTNKFTIELNDNEVVDHLRKYSTEYQTNYVTHIIKTYINHQNTASSDKIEYFTEHDRMDEDCSYDNDENLLIILLVVLLFITIIGEKFLR